MKYLLCYLLNEKYFSFSFIFISVLNKYGNNTKSTLYFSNTMNQNISSSFFCIHGSHGCVWPSLKIFLFWVCCMRRFSKLLRQKTCWMWNFLFTKTNFVCKNMALNMRAWWCFELFVQRNSWILICDMRLLNHTCKIINFFGQMTAKKSKELH